MISGESGNAAVQGRSQKSIKGAGDVNIQGLDDIGSKQEMLTGNVIDRPMGWLDTFNIKTVPSSRVLLVLEVYIWS